MISLDQFRIVIENSQQLMIYIIITRRGDQGDYDTLVIY